MNLDLDLFLTSPIAVRAHLGRQLQHGDVHGPHGHRHDPQGHVQHALLRTGRRHGRDTHDWYVDGSLGI